MNLILETKDQPNKTLRKKINENTFIVAPWTDEKYWRYRVAVSENQAIVGFPKFNTVGIGFQIEEDWNTNLPYTEKAETILNHIWHNRGKGNNGTTFRQRCLDAIRMIQQTI